MQKRDMDRAKIMAAQIAASWSDEYFGKKHPEDLVMAYGVTLQEAARILKEERSRRAFMVKG